MLKIYNFLIYPCSSLAVQEHSFIDQGCTVEKRVPNVGTGYSWAPETFNDNKVSLQSGIFVYKIGKLSSLQ
jgi:hypothetical protein